LSRFVDRFTFFSFAPILIPEQIFERGDSIMKTRTYGIPSWSNKVFRARKTYRCDNCGGTIPHGTKYLRHVVRLGPRKFRDPLKNLHMHLDCEAPWYQPDNQTHRLRNIGKLQVTAPVPTAGREQIAEPHPLNVSSATLGHLTWEPGPMLATALATSSTGPAARAEMETILGVILTALSVATGDRRKAMKVNNLMTQLISEIAL
jgi:hypothetical protein